jgi:predicted dehydrogenase
MIRTGIIGFGKMGRIRAAAVEDSGRGIVASIHEPSAEPGAPKHVADPRDIIADPTIDAVFVCTPNFLNKPLTIAALTAGKHVFCEKPPAFTARDIEEIRAVELASGKRLMYGFNHRHHESVQVMKRIVDDGELGRILWMRGRYGKEVDARFFEGWRARKELAGGGIMLDQGIHMLDLFLYLSGGTFDEVQAMVSNLYWHIDGIEDNVFANFRDTRTGLCASLHSTMTQWRYIFSLEVFLEKGALVLNGLKTPSGAYGDEDLAIKRNRDQHVDGRFENEERRLYHTDPSWSAEIGQFFDSIEQGRAPVSGTSAEALELMRIIDRIYGRSASGPAGG